MTDTKPASTDYVIYRKLLSMGMSCSNVIVKNLGPSSSYVQTWALWYLALRLGYTELIWNFLLQLPEALCLHLFLLL